MEKTKNNIKLNKEYILQDEDRDKACTLIALMNHVIHRDGKCPIAYRSKEFWKLCDECEGGRTAGILDVIHALTFFKIDHWFWTEVKDMTDFRESIKKQLTLGRTVLMSVNNYDDTNHSILLLDYNKERDVFVTVNAQHYGREDVVEMVSWFDLTFHFFGSSGKMRKFGGRSALERSFLATYILK